MRIVSVTPLGVERDSRTFKQAASFSRLGHESIVLEAGRSERPEDLPFQVVSIGTAPGSPDTPSVVASEGIARAGGQARKLAKRLAGPARGPLHAAAALAGVLSLRCGLLWRTARALPRADLYVLHSHVQFPAVWLNSRRYRVPFIYDAHDFYSVLASDGRPRPWSERVLAEVDRAVERRCVRSAATITTVSDGLSELISARFGRRPTVIRNAHDTRLDHQSEMDVRTAAGLDNDVFLLVVVGNWKRGMAVESALEALVALPTRVHIAWIGAGYEHCRAEAERLSLSDRAHFLPPVNPVEVRAFIAGADLAPILYQPVTPSHRSALPNGFFHAVAAGIPILYPPELPELASLGERYRLGQAVDTAAPAELARVIEVLLADPKRMALMREQVRSATRELGWEHEERILALLIEAYRPHEEGAPCAD